jgi:phage FluMu gp28-like protein
MPMLADTNGDAIFISTPRGHDWFYELALLGMDPLEPDWDFFSFPTMANPYISLDFIEDMREKLPDDVFRQEILAEFLADGARVFKNVDVCIAGELEDPKPGHHYLIGYDPAKHTDFAVMIVFDCDTRHVVGFLRSKNVEYLDQVQRLVLLAHLYNHASIIMDSTGVGDPLLEQVKSISNEMGDELVVEGFLFTQTSKKELVQRLMVGIERRQFTFPNIPELVSELKAFGYQISASRNIVYSAPEGAHDDCVMALGLAIFGAKLGTSIPLLRSSRGSIAQEGIPAIRKFEDVPEDTQKELARRQAITSHVLSQVLGNSPWR